MALTCGSHNVADIRDWNGVDPTGTNECSTGIQAAIDSGETYIHAGRGKYKVGNTLKFGSNTSNYKSTKFVGDGCSDASGNAATEFRWYGAANGAMMQMTSCQHCYFSDFMLDGSWANAPGYGLLVTAVNAGGGASHENTFERISALHINGSPGIGLDLNGDFYSNNQDASTSIYRDIRLYHCLTAVRQLGNQSISNVLEDIECAYYTTGINFQKGDIRMLRCKFTGDTTSVDDVYVENTADWASIYDSYHEIFSAGPATRHAYNFPDGSRPYSTVMVGNRVLWGLTSGTPLFYRQFGSFTLIGGSFDGAPSGTSSLSIDAPGSGEGTTITGVTLGSFIKIRRTGNNAAGMYNGSLWLPNDAEPMCDASTRGQLLMVQGGSGVKDTVRVCAKDAANAYAWRTLY